IVTIIVLSIDGNSVLSSNDTTPLFANILMLVSFVIYILALACYEDRHGCMGDKVHMCLGVYCMAMHMAWIGVTIASIVLSVTSYANACSENCYSSDNAVYVNLLVYLHIW